MNNNSPIGLFDSGIGGISIYNEIKKTLPNESTIYLGDNLNAPYGKKTKEEIIQLSLKNTQKLIDLNCKLIVVACNTATTNAITILRESFDIPINFKEIDCDIYTDVADQYNIDGYPTIKLLYKTEVYDYDATPDRYRLMEFLKGSLPSNPFSEKALEKDVKEVEKDVWTVIQ